MQTPKIHTSLTPGRKIGEDARQYAYRVIRQAIMERTLPPGQQLKEMDLAQDLCISRTPVHDAISRLSREHMVEIIPNRGAFVSVIHCSRIRQAIWIHQEMGNSVIQKIYINNVPKSQLSSLYLYLEKMHAALDQEHPSRFISAALFYFQQLYHLGEPMDLLLYSMQTIDADMRRIIYLSVDNRKIMEEYFHDLNELTEALIHRECNRACQIYSQHLSRLLLLIAPLRQQYPEFFSDSVDPAA